LWNCCSASWVSWILQVLLFVSEVHGIGFLHDFLFLNTSVQFGGLMMDSEVFFHYLSILPWVGLHQHLLTLTTRTGEQYVIDPKPYCAFFSPSLRFCYKVNNANFTCSSEILKLALSLLSCSLIDLTLLVEVTCQLGRYI
jgi:hypothetical protein